MTTPLRYSALVLLLAGLVARASAAPAPPDELVRTTAEDVRKELQARSAEFAKDPDSLERLVERRVVPLFDVDKISQTVLGRYWREATPDQRKRFGMAMQQNFVRGYSRALLAYRNYRFDWAATKLAAGATDVTVKSTIYRDNGPALPVFYNMHRDGERWLIYDVVIDGISMATNFRVAYAAQIKKFGIEAVIQHMEAGQRPPVG